MAEQTKSNDKVFVIPCEYVKSYLVTKLEICQIFDFGSEHGKIMRKLILKGYTRTIDCDLAVAKQKQMYTYRWTIFVHLEAVYLSFLI